MLPKKSSNTSNLTPSEPLKKTASAPKPLIFAAAFAVAAILVVAGIAVWSSNALTGVQIGGASIRVTVVDTEEERQKGLSGSTHLADGSGMLFVFPYDAKWPIWMKDMSIPLDIIWIDVDKRVVHVEADVKPESYPAYFSPPRNARYVLELASGMAAKAGITQGAVAQFDVSAATK